MEWILAFLVVVLALGNYAHDANNRDLRKEIEELETYIRKITS